MIAPVALQTDIEIVSRLHRTHRDTQTSTALTGASCDNLAGQQTIIALNLTRSFENDASTLNIKRDLDGIVTRTADYAGHCECRDRKGHCTHSLLVGCSLHEAVGGAQAAEIASRERTRGVRSHHLGKDHEHIGRKVGIGRRENSMPAYFIVYREGPAKSNRVG